MSLPQHPLALTRTWVAEMLQLKSSLKNLPAHHLDQSMCQIMMKLWQRAHGVHFRCTVSAGARDQGNLHGLSRSLMVSFSPAINLSP